jgi:2-iminobutanoate/2-iminopropanoate deaminase
VPGAREARTERAPAPVGPYSQAVVHGGLVFVSGQIPLDPGTGEVVEGEIEAQAGQVFANLSAVLEAAGSNIERVLRTSVYLTDLSLFPRVNAVYERHFTGDPKPARSTIGVATLPLGVQIEVDAIAATDTDQ